MGHEEYSPLKNASDADKPSGHIEELVNNHHPIPARYKQLVGILTMPQ